MVRSDDLGARGESTAIGGWTTVESVFLAARHGGIPALQRGPAIDGVLGPRKPKVDFDSLFAIAVRRSHQGKSSGHELMAPTMERIDRAGAAAWIEISNEKNLTFYQRFGLEITDEVQLAPDGPDMGTLWRAGRRSVDRRRPSRRERSRSASGILPAA